MLQLTDGRTESKSTLPSISPPSVPTVSGFVSTSNDNTIKVWDTGQRGELLSTLRGHEGAVYFAAFSADGNRIVSTSGDNTIKVWDGEQGGEPLFTRRVDDVFAVGSVVISADGKRIVWVRRGAKRFGPGKIKVWDMQRGDEALFTLRGHAEEINSVVLSADGRRIVSGDGESLRAGHEDWESGGEIKVWDAERGAEALLTLRGHKGPITSLAINTDGERIVSGSEDKTIKVWDAK